MAQWSWQQERCVALSFFSQVGLSVCLRAFGVKSQQQLCRDSEAVSRLGGLQERCVALAQVGVSAQERWRLLSFFPHVVLSSCVLISFLGGVLRAGWSRR